MCLTAPALVLAVDGDSARIRLDGRERRASTLVVPDVRPGDWVIVAAGTILERLDPVRAARVASAVAEAFGTKG